MGLFSSSSRAEREAAKADRADTARRYDNAAKKHAKEAARLRAELGRPGADKAGLRSVIKDQEANQRICEDNARSMRR